MQTPFNLYSDRCWVETRLQPAMIRIENGRITHVEKGRQSGEGAEFRFRDLIVMPGAIDVHTHINEPGRTDWEGFETATRAAVSGGATTLIDMPLNSSPVTVNKTAFQAKRAAAAQQLHVNCGFWAGATGPETTDLAETIDAGCLGVKVFLIHSGIDEFPHISPEALDKIMPVLRKKNVPLLAHCEIVSGLEKPVDFYPTESYPAYLASRPKSWENEAIRLLIDLCRKHRVKTHIVHLSSDEALPMIRDAKAEGLPLTVETCPHYIYFNAENIPDGRTEFKCAPPIREAPNNHQLILALQSGLIDLIASDHSPAPPDLKEVQSGNLAKAWGGIAGVQFLLPAAWTALRNDLTLEQFIPLLTAKPAALAGLDRRKGALKPGFDADMVIWDPDGTFVVRKEDILHKHKITPYLGETLYGKVYGTIVNGCWVFRYPEWLTLHAGEILLREQEA